MGSRRRGTSFTRFFEDIVDDTKDLVDDLIDRAKDVEDSRQGLVRRRRRRRGRRRRRRRRQRGGGPAEAARRTEGEDRPVDRHGEGLGGVAERNHGHRAEVPPAPAQEDPAKERRVSLRRHRATPDHPCRAARLRARGWALRSAPAGERRRLHLRGAPERGGGGPVGEPRPRPRRRVAPRARWPERVSPAGGRSVRWGAEADWAVWPGCSVIRSPAAASTTAMTGTSPGGARTRGGPVSGAATTTGARGGPAAAPTTGRTGPTAIGAKTRPSGDIPAIGTGPMPDE